MRLIAPPLPAVSRPSKMTSTRLPSCATQRASRLSSTSSGASASANLPALSRLDSSPLAKPALVLRTDIANCYGSPLPAVLFSELIAKPVEQGLVLDAATALSMRVDPIRRDGGSRARRVRRTWPSACTNRSVSIVARPPGTWNADR